MENSEDEEDENEWRNSFVDSPTHSPPAAAASGKLGNLS